ncbi:MAG TPA: host attachment protein [Verrucomicrobiae bacterium]|jgi:hypothetical protein|nr:host attachment protein [Verrucomicrobiae bacterium]
MKNTLIVVADLEGFKAYRLDKSDLHSNPRLELVEQFDHPTARSHVLEQVTDLSGRYRRGENGTAFSDGERHNFELEQRKRCVRQVAAKLNTVLKDPGVERCFLSASREINRSLLDELDGNVRGKIEMNIPAALTKVNKSELLDHFKAPGARA